MKPLKRITFDPGVMGGKPCIRGMRAGDLLDRVKTPFTAWA
jgi:uncharacterized protein (DUF433 family)